MDACCCTLKRRLSTGGVYFGWLVRHIRANDCWCPRQMNRELWAIAPGTHERYLVSIQGRIRNGRTALTLKVRVGTRGYEYFLACLPRRRAVYLTVHRLMAQAFLHNPDPSTCDTPALVNHIDGNPLNNTLSNLRFDCRSKQSHNSQKRRNCLSIYRGVTTNAAPKTSQKLCYSLGRHAKQEEAAACYNDAAVRLYGACAHLNSFPSSQV